MHSGGRVRKSVGPVGLRSGSLGTELQGLGFIGFIGFRGLGFRGLGFRVVETATKRVAETLMGRSITIVEGSHVGSDPASTQASDGNREL